VHHGTDGTTYNETLMEKLAHLEVVTSPSRQRCYGRSRSSLRRRRTSRPLIRVADYLALLEQHTYDGSRVRRLDA
jgi:hypothetical protein